MSISASAIGPMTEDFAKLVVPVLRERLAEAGLDTKGNKPVLVQRLREYHERQQQQLDRDKQAEDSGTGASKRPREPKQAELKSPKTSETIDDDDGFDDDLYLAAKRSRLAGGVRACPYLDTVNRALLAFDYEKQCSVTLATRNVYACLVCGKYLQGRAEGTPAMDHSLQVDHHVFMHLTAGPQQGRVFCLPENYEVEDPSLADIRYLLDPTFSESQIESLDRPVLLQQDQQQQQQQEEEHVASEASSIDLLLQFRRRALDGTPFIPGIPGLNNLNQTDYANAVVQALARVAPFRNWLLVKCNTQPLTLQAAAQAAAPMAAPSAGAILSTDTGADLTSRLGELYRRMFNPRAFRHHVSPHEFMLAAARASSNRFRIGTTADPIEFVTFLLATLNLQMMNRLKLLGRPKEPTLIQRIFRGQVRVRERKALTDATQAQQLQKQQYNWTQKHVPFFVLTLDVPPPPVFRNPLEAEKQIVLQTTLRTLLEKFSDKRDVLDAEAHTIRRYMLTKLPDCLVLNLKRFMKNQWFKEKNPTIVNFPFRNLDMSPYMVAPSGSSVASPSAHNDELYELVAVVSHNGPVDGGSYSAFVLHRPSAHWFECDDLRVTDVTQDLDKITLSEACMLIYSRQTA